ncbi:MAG: lysoplasmalogenase [Candidatus Thorarchaeota archaeon]|nr:lysoplasmalogenase [Candidatus Thorarchaeota archaeon]
MTEKYLKSIIDYVRLLAIIGILILVSAFIVTGDTIPWFLSSSIAIAILAFVNFIDLYQENNKEWKTYALLLLLAMLCGTFGDFLMAGIIYITPERLINGILLFGIGHVFYLLGLRNRSPLLIQKRENNGNQIISRNLVVWILSVIVILVIFYLTVFNPTMLEMSIGALGYGIILVTVLAFSITKWLDRLTLSYRLAIILGFLLFLFSDWLLAYQYFTDPTFLSGPYVGITYAFGQLLIQLTTYLGSRGI